MATYERRHFAGYEPEISAYKATVEAALPSVSGFWLLPEAGAPPVSMTDTGTVSMFSVCVTAGTALPARPDYVLQFPDGVMERFEGALASAMAKMPAAIKTAIPAKPGAWPKGAAALNTARNAVLTVAAKVRDDLAAAELAAEKTVV